MDPHDENDDSRESGTRGYITEEQYMDLNIRIQKATQRYFNYEEAKQIAIDD